LQDIKLKVVSNYNLDSEIKEKMSQVSTMAKSTEEVFQREVFHQKMVIATVNLPPLTGTHVVD
jgi:hypothetical protein